MTTHSWTPLTRAAVIVGIAVALGTPTAWMLLMGTRGAEIANIFALPATVAGLVVSIIGFQRRPQVYDATQLDTAVQSLLREVTKREGKVLQQLLSDVGHAVPADLRFMQPKFTHWRTDGGNEAGSLRSIGAFYRSLRFGRLVVLGEPGAGKTVLAIQLVLDLASPGSHQVPLRLSLAEFPADDTLDGWLAKELVAGFRQPKDLAVALVASGRVLPVLDGLDEMDGSTPDRAKKVVQALNSPTARPLVLTCRTGRYEQLGDSVVEDSTAVVTQPLDADQVIVWLTHRFGDRSQDDGLQRRWRPVVSQLRRRPNGSLAKALSSPLGLYLAVTTYRDPTTSPKALCALKADDIFDHLLSRFVDAVTRAHGRFPAAAVTGWLRHLSIRLDRAGAYSSTVDLHLDRLWLGNVRSAALFRLASAAVNTCLVASPMLVFTCLLVALEGSSAELRSDLTGLAMLIGLMAAIAFLRSGRSQMVHRQFDRGALTTAHLKSSALISVLLGAMLGAVHGGPAGLTTIHGVSAGVTWTVGIMAMFLLGGGFASSGRATAGPVQTVRSGLVHDITVVAGFGALTYVCRSLSLVFSGEPLLRSSLNSVGFLLLGLSIGLLVRASSPWPRYLLFVWRSSRTGRLPRNLAAFFDWAVDAGLLRIAGSAVQFRHAEFQEWLRRT
jgi:hypothetical protein